MTLICLRRSGRDARVQWYGTKNAVTQSISNRRNKDLHTTSIADRLNYKYWDLICRNVPAGDQGLTALGRPTRVD